MPKTFRAPDVLSALNQVQTELGPDALVLSVREIQDGPAWKIWEQPQVEVLAMDPNTESMPEAVAEKAERALPESTTGRDDGAASKEDLQESVPVHEESQMSDKPLVRRLPKNLEKAKKMLLFQGVDPASVEKLISTCQQSLSPGALLDEKRIHKHLTDQIKVSIKTVRSNQIGKKKGIFFLGPSGAGKTSTVAKMAIHFSETQDRSVVWVCADTIRAGAIAEAKAYTDILNLPMVLAYSPEDLAQIFSEANEQEHLVLVDMPSINPRRETDLIMVGEFLTAVPVRETYLLAPATAKDVDLQQLIAAFSAFDIDGMIITKLDESETVGNVVNTAGSSRLPLAFFTSGPQVIDRLEHADPVKLVERLFS